MGISWEHLLLLLLMLAHAGLNKIQTSGAVVQWDEKMYSFVKHEQNNKMLVSY